jgi:hypothetical protein
MKTPNMTAPVQQAHASHGAAGSMLPIHSMSLQTRHMLQAHSSSASHHQRMLYVFAVVLAIAIACALLLVVSSGTAFAAPAGAAGTLVSKTSAVMAIGLSLTTSVLAAFTVIHLSLSARH